MTCPGHRHGNETTENWLDGEIEWMDEVLEWADANDLELAEKMKTLKSYHDGKAR